MFHQPLIPPNTGNAIRMVAATGAALHLIKPLGFNLSDTQLRRAGLDYHDLSRVFVHENFDDAARFVAEHGSGRIFAFTGKASMGFSDVAYARGDCLLFGTETTGLPDSLLDDSRITGTVRIPMLDAIRSLNLSNAAAVAAYEAWRQHDFVEPPAGWLPPQTPVHRPY